MLQSRRPTSLLEITVRNRRFQNSLPRDNYALADTMSVFRRADKRLCCDAGDPRATVRNMISTESRDVTITVIDWSLCRFAAI
jgi:hypothetical protein